VLVQQVQRRRKFIRPRPVPQLNRQPVIHECLQQPGQVIHRCVIALEAGRELAEQCAKFVGGRERLNAPLEDVHVVLRHCSFVRELLE
jgi:hypothetical protein